MLVDRDIVRGFTYISIGDNDDGGEHELCVEQTVEYYEEAEAYGDTYVSAGTYCDVVDEHYILNGNYVDIEELKLLFGGDTDKLIADAIQDMEY